MFPPVFRFCVWLAVLPLLVQCGPLHLPNCTVVQRKVPPAEEAIASARAAWQRLDHHDPAVREAAAREYNEATAALFERLRRHRGGWEAGAANLGTKLALPGARNVPLTMFDEVLPAGLINVETVGKRQTIGHVGAPVVGWWDRRDPPRRPFAPPTGTAAPLTAVLRFDQEDAPAWHFYRHGERNEIRIGNRSHQLRYDLSAPIAYYWQKSRLDDLSVLNVFLPGRFVEETGLFFAEPYDPERIPVVLVHGLNSSPYTFRRLANRLAADPGLAKRYQLWFFHYPTGNPWAYSAALFREDMRAAASYARANGGAETIDDLVIVAHSMGGLLTRSSISEPGHVFYGTAFTKPFDELVLTPRQREIVRAVYLYEPLEEPARVVFMAVPHRGSPLSERFFASLLARLVRLPATLTMTALQITAWNADALLQSAAGRDVVPTGINSLSPRSSGIVALQHMPIRPGVEIHSIIGNGGYGRDSDGIVPYWSSHFPLAETEMIVPAGHSLTGHPAVVDEVMRLLHLHLRER